MKLSLPRLDTLRPRERLLAVASGAVVMVVLLDRLVLSPWIRHARTIREEATRLEDAVERADRLLLRREEIAAELAAYQRYLGPPVEAELQMASLLQEVEDLAAASGVTIGEIKPLGTTREGRTVRHTLDIRFEADTAAWVDFVFRLETSPLLFSLVQSGLTVPEEQSDRLQGYLRAVNSSVLPDEAAAGEPAS
jgi:hypothetical protein